MSWLQFCSLIIKHFVFSTWWCMVHGEWQRNTLSNPLYLLRRFEFIIIVPFKCSSFIFMLRTFNLYFFCYVVCFLWVWFPFLSFTFFICIIQKPARPTSRSDGRKRQGKQDELITNTISFSLFYCNGRRYHLDRHTHSLIQSTNAIASNGNQMWEMEIEGKWLLFHIKYQACRFLCALWIINRKRFVFVVHVKLWMLLLLYAMAATLSAFVREIYIFVCVCESKKAKEDKTQSYYKMLECGTRVRRVSNSSASF